MKKKFCLLLALVICLFASCGKDEDAVPEPEPQPEPKPVIIKESAYETTDDYVDLGFDHVMFATKNLGAKRPEDAGSFFAWGETEPKNVYSLETYKLQSSNLYYKDGARLQPKDDAATVILGEGWRLPTGDEVKLLQDSYTTDDNCCRMRSILSNGVYGYLFIGPNGNTIFIPYTEFMKDGELMNWDNFTSRLWTSDCGRGSALTIFTVSPLGVSFFDSMERYCGLPIRPVKEKKAESDTIFLKYNVLERNIADAQNLLTALNGSAPASPQPSSALGGSAADSPQPLSALGGSAAEDFTPESLHALEKAYQRAVAMRAYVKENDGQINNQSIYVINKINKPLQDSIDHASHFLRLAIVDLQPVPKPSDIKAVDLGLSVRWASANLGARSETENGYFIAWGELAPKQGRYEWETYKFCSEVYDGDRDYSKFSKYVTDSRWGEVDGKTRLDLEDDAAHDFLGGDWRIPTPEEFQELVDNCTFENVGLNGHTVMKATGPNGNYILFPHSGSTSIIDEIYCWTTDMTPAANQHAVCYSIHSFWGNAYKTWEDRFVGMTIRAVCP